MKIIVNIEENFYNVGVFEYISFQTNKHNLFREQKKEERTLNKYNSSLSLTLSLYLSFYVHDTNANFPYCKYELRL